MTPDWANANCAGYSHHPVHNPDAFYPPNGRPAITIIEYCANCPIRHDCLNWAIHHEAHGYWGGTTEEDRHHIRRTANVTLTRPEHNANIEPVRTLAPECGCMAAVRRHQERGEPLDTACATAERYSARKRLQHLTRKQNEAR